MGLGEKMFGTEYTEGNYCGSVCVLEIIAENHSEIIKLL